MDDQEDDIRVRAHRLWEEAGRPEDRDQEFWFGAINKASAAATPPGSLTGEKLPLDRGPSGMEQTVDQGNLINNVSTVK